MIQKCKLLSTLIILSLFSCKEKKHTVETKEKKHTVEKSDFDQQLNFQAILDLQKWDEDVVDTLDRYINQINYSDCKCIESELKMVHLRDQQYRDSIQSQPNPYSDSKRVQYFVKKMQEMDQINEKIVWQILKTRGWSDTCKMENDAHMAIWCTIYHSSNAKFKLNSLNYVHAAFEDSVLTPEFYAYLIDKIYVKNGKKQLYGTFPKLGKYKKFPYRISKSIDSINLERKLIGLEPLILTKQQENSSY